RPRRTGIILLEFSLQAVANRLKPELQLSPIFDFRPPPMQVSINGKLFDRENAKISVFDHGLLYGDGVFEGMRSYGGKVFRLEQHLERLWNSARAIWLEIPISRPAMAKAVNDTLAVNKLRDAYIRLVVT